ncbi:MAG: hypothetical protein HKN82_10985 [Akkermansiaceae bacterium]|nr:hypothetical protein [Akkermansiaceae bacterium]NNM30934.1 hypothetical protein [Akkermansiaceae bacterium]
MDWIKENKAVAGLGIVTLLVAGGLYFLGSSWASKQEEALLAFEDNRNQLQRLESQAPYPDKAHLDETRKKVTEYRGRVEGLQKSLLTFRPKSFEKIPPADFSNRLNDANGKVKALYTERGIEFPDDWQLGFESYTGAPPEAEATAFLNYELEAMVWLYTQLAQAGPAALLNVVRQPLPVEEGKPMDGGKDAAPYFSLPIELTFRGREAAVRRFIAGLVDSDAYFFTIRSIRIQNDKFESVPEKDDVEFKEAPAASPFGGAFDNFVVPDDLAPVPEEGAPAEGEAAPAEEAVPPPPEEEAGGERVLGQVLGAEQLNVHLELELLLFRGNVNLPTANPNT